MADPRPAAAGDAVAPMTRRERRELERRAAREARAAEEVTASSDGVVPPSAPAPAASAPSPASAASAPSPASAPAVAAAASTTSVGSVPAPLAEDGRALAEPATTVVDSDAAGQEPAPEHHAPARVADGQIPDITTPLPSGGRNVPVAIGVGLGLGLLVIASLFFWRKEAFLGLAILACGLGLWELGRAVHVRDIKLPLLPLLVGTVGMMVSAYTAGVEALLVAAVLTSGGAFVWRVLDGGGVPALRDATAAMFATAYLPFLGGFIALMLAADDGAWRVLAFICVCVASDTGGYIAGVLFGKTRLAPIVSPKKSWEGLIGSYVAAAGIGVLTMTLALDGPWWGGLALGVAGVTAATLGDLAESLLKRDLGVKDMGTLLPGHGGVLDRVDSVLFAAPVAFTIFYLVLGSGR